MANTYTNALSYLNVKGYLDAETAGYINTVLYGASVMAMTPIVPTSEFMVDKYWTRGRAATSRTQNRSLNQDYDAKQSNPFKANNEHTYLYGTETDMDYKLAGHKPEVFDKMMKDDLVDLMTDLDSAIFNDTVSNDGKKINGLKARFALGSEFDVPGDSSGALTINTSATTMKQLLRRFRLAVDKIKRSPGMQVVAFCNETLEQAITSGRDELGTGTMTVTVGEVFGQRVTMVDGIPLVKVRDDSVGSPILDFDEADDASSIWICGIGGGAGEGSEDVPNGMVILSNVDGGDLIQKPEPTVFKTQIYQTQEIEIGLRTPERSVVRLSGLKAVED
jgi:hypothetical protein